MPIPSAFADQIIDILDADTRVTDVTPTPDGNDVASLSITLDNPWGEPINFNWFMTSVAHLEGLTTQQVTDGLDTMISDIIAQYAPPPPFEADYDEELVELADGLADDYTRVPDWDLQQLRSDALNIDPNGEQPETHLIWLELYRRGLIQMASASE